MVPEVSVPQSHIRCHEPVVRPSASITADPEKSLVVEPGTNISSAFFSYSDVPVTGSTMMSPSWHGYTRICGDLRKVIIKR